MGLFFCLKLLDESQSHFRIFLDFSHFLNLRKGTFKRASDIDVSQGAVHRISTITHKDRTHKCTLLLVSLEFLLSLFLAMKVRGVNIFAVFHHLGCLPGPSHSRLYRGRCFCLRRVSCPISFFFNRRYGSRLDRKLRDVWRFGLYHAGTAVEVDLLVKQGL